MGTVERILFVGFVVCFFGTVAFIATGVSSWVLFLFIPLGGLLVLSQLCYAVWGMLQVPLARRREAARARTRDTA
jgi:hypothetical protein